MKKRTLKVNNVVYNDNGELRTIGGTYDIQDEEPQEPNRLWHDLGLERVL